MKKIEDKSNGIVRINLGCGSKLLPYSEGWVNVDIVDPPEVVLDTVAQVSGIPFDDKEVNEKTINVFHAADIRNMKFVKSGTVHEVHAYHVIEHFAPHELPALLNEIRRVLHPEMGCLVCEQPNVIKCAKNMLQVETTKEPQLWYNLGLLGFYGEPDPANPYMLHKWGWWPESLTDMLLRNGFKAVVQQNAKTHAGDVRDFRLVAFVNKIPANIETKTDQGAATQTLSKQAINSGIGLKNPQNGKHEPLVITPQDSVPSKNLLDNIQTNSNLLKNWITRSRVHKGKAFLVSAGPSLERHAERLKAGVPILYTKEVRASNWLGLRGTLINGFKEFWNSSSSVLRCPWAVGSSILSPSLTPLVLPYPIVGTSLGVGR